MTFLSCGWREDYKHPRVKKKKGHLPENGRLQSTNTAVFIFIPCKYVFVFVFGKKLARPEAGENECKATARRPVQTQELIYI